MKYEIKANHPILKYVTTVASKEMLIETLLELLNAGYELESVLPYTNLSTFCTCSPYQLENYGCVCKAEN